MSPQKIRRSGKSLVVTIPEELVRELDLVEGDVVGLTIEKLEKHPALSPELQALLDESWEKNKAAYRYLAEH